MRALRNNQINVEEGMLIRQLCDGGLLRQAQGGLFYERDWKGWSIEQLMNALPEYIDWYNGKRIKVSLGGLSPVR